MAETSTVGQAPGAKAIRFDGTARIIGDRTIVRLPADASAELPSRGQVAVTGTANGYAFQSVLEPDGMRGHWLDVDGALQRTVGDGDTVTLDIQPTKEWPEPTVPDDLRAALADAPETSELWTSITPMARWEWVRWINATKNPVTRDRRVEVAISKLHAGKRRPCCFDLSSCTDPELSKGGNLVDAM